MSSPYTNLYDLTKLYFFTRVFSSMIAFLEAGSNHTKDVKMELTAELHIKRQSKWNALAQNSRSSTGWLSTQLNIFAF